MHILTGCYVAKPKGHSHISKHCGARMRNENGVWHVWQDVETFARNTHALILKKNAERKKVKVFQPATGKLTCVRN